MTKKDQHSNLSGELDRYRAIFEQSLTANFILSADGEILDSNAAACRLFGYDCEMLTGKPIGFLFDENPLPRAQDRSSSFQGELKRQSKEGTKKIFNYQFSTFETDSGRKFRTLQLIDITENAGEAEHLKLLEAVVKGANDAVLITSADALESPDGPKIVFVNHAFTEMTGYNSEEVIGKTPRILQGPETPGDELRRLRNAIKNFTQVEVELLNYKKNGEEFWVHISLSPVFDGDRCTHFIAIERDVTTRKNQEYLKTLQTEVGRIFNHHKILADSIAATLNVLINIGDFSLAEIWTVDDEKQTISLTGYQSKDNIADEFYDISHNVQVFMKGEGLPGSTWETGEIQVWRDLDKREDFARHRESKAVGVKTAYGVPLYFDDKVIGMLLLGILDHDQNKRYYIPLLEQLGQDLGSKINRKQTEEQLSRIFKFSPGIICVAGMDGYFKKVNPAMSRLLGYTQDELLSHPISSFTHPDDRLRTEAEIDALNTNNGAQKFENRLLTKTGSIIWLSWTTRTFSEEDKIYSIARDVTEEKELKDLLKQANQLAKIGSWKIDIVNDEIYWSEITREIHEVDSEYQPKMVEAINFYKEGDSRTRIEKAVEKAIKQGVSYDIEVPIITAKGNERWIRAIGKPELVAGKCVRLYGSFQDIHERKSAEQKQLELSKERERILESIGDGFFTVDKNFIVTYWNKNAEKLLKTPREEILHQYLWDRFPDATNLESYKQYNTALRENRNVSFEDYYPPINRWFEISAYPYDEGLTVFFKDITSRKEAQNQILKKTSQLDAIAMFNGLLIKSGHWENALQESLEIIGKVVEADRVYFFQNKYNEKIGESTASIICEWTDECVDVQLNHPAHTDIPFSELEEFLERLAINKPYSSIVEEIPDLTFRQFLKDQNIKSILAIPVFVGDRFYGCIGFDDCSTKRKWSKEEVSFLKTIALNLASAIENEEAKQALQKSFEEKNEILESIGDAFFAVNKNWIVTYWNNRAEEVLYMPREDVVGMNLWDVYEDAAELDFFSQYQKAVNEQVTVTFEEYYPAADKWFDVSAYPSPDGLSVFFKDITDRKKSDKILKELNQTLKQQTVELAASNAELEQFAFVASHDLQEPLRMVTSFLSQLEKKYADELDEKAKKYIWFATDGARRMRQIIMDLLNYSRFGRVEIEKAPIDLNQIMKSIVQDYREIIKETKAIVKWNTLPVITADQTSVKRLLSNLVSNALKYHSDGIRPEIIVGAKETEDTWTVSVSDNGIGINPEYSEKIFNIFQRLHSNDEYSGTGIGLAVCRKIVDSHGGNIWMESVEGEGSTFYFTIPKE